MTRKAARQLDYSERIKPLSIDVDALQQSLLADIARFKQEALAVHDTLVLPT